tara:strand:+ start:1453 stop:1755 length:303 start_codon:yes stop_codon:yes gene_type:complete
MKILLSMFATCITLFAGCGLLLKGESPHKNQHLTTREVDWLKIKVYLSESKKKSEWKQKYKHAYKLAKKNKRVAWWIDASMGSILILFTFLLVWFNLRKR